MKAILTFEADKRKALFDKLADQYFLADIFSLGYANYLRKKLVKISNATQKEKIIDFMSGQGELSKKIRGFNTESVIYNVDFSKSMINNDKNKSLINNIQSSILDFESKEKVDLVLSSFGLKTLQKHEIEGLAKKTKLSLKKGGEFYFVEFNFNFIEYITIGLFLFPLILFSSIVYNYKSIYHLFFLKYTFSFNRKYILHSLSNEFEDVKVKRLPGVIFISGKNGK